MQSRFTSFALLGVLALLGAFVAEPYVARYLLAAETPRTVAARGELAGGETSTIELFRRVSPSVVHVFSQPSGRGYTEPGGDEERGGGGQSGSGFVWDAAGHVVTNHHVVQGARRLSARLASGEIVSAEIVGSAPANDLAVLRLGRVATPPPAVAVGESGGLQVGQTVYAIGSPFGLDQTLTTGIVSALHRRIPTEGNREISDVIQTDAAINPGNSGGPLLDSAGRLIGVNTAIYSPSGASAGIGVAIPVDVVNRVVPELIRTGRVPQPGIGIVAGNEATTSRLGIRGVVIVRTVPGSPAERAGLRGVDPPTGEVGDVIVAANGRPVRRLTDLTGTLEQAGVGKPAELQVERDGRARTVRVEVADVSRQPS